MIETHSTGYEGFDPLLHATGADGKPRLTKLGEYAKKRGPRGPRTALPSPDSTDAFIGGEKSVIEQPVTRASAKSAASGMAGLVVGTGIAIFGSEWVPKQSESDNLTLAFTEYFMIRGIINLPPEIGLIVAIGAYAYPRTKLPETSAKIAKIKSKFMGNKNEVENVDQT